MNYATRQAATGGFRPEAEELFRISGGLIAAPRWSCPPVITVLVGAFGAVVARSLL
jgi:hypothetical protein